MDIRQIEYVVGVVDHGGFTRAAAALFVSQPSLSYGIRALETELGLPLFHRTGRGVVLSSAGEAFVEAGRQVLRDMETLRASILAIKGERGGRLDLVCLPSLAAAELVPLMAEFRALRPHVFVRLDEPESPSRLLELIREGECELGLTELTDHTPDGLLAHRLYEEEILAVYPPGSPKPKEGRIRFADLLGVPIVTTPLGSSSRDMIDQAFRSICAAPTIAVETNQRQAIVAMVLSGIGAAFVPAATAARIRGLGVVVVHTDPPLTRTIGMVHRNGILSPAAVTFLDLALKTRYP